MALKSYSVPLTSVTSLIASNSGKFGKMTVFVNNLGGNHDCFVGASNVSITNGYVLNKFSSTGIANKLEIELFAGDTLYGVCDAGKDTTLGVLLTGQFGES
jgi:hypothetical protein